MNKLLLLLFTLFLSSTAWSQSVHDFDSLYKKDQKFKESISKQNNTQDFFDENLPVLKFTLSSDFKNLVKNKDESKYQKATIDMMINDTVKYSQKLKIKTRGALRKSICAYPPLKLNFPKKDMHVESLREFDKMKMVSNCKPGDKYGQYVLSEFLTYQIYNIITDYSFRVRLLEVNYIDTGGRFKPSTRHSFIIEPINQLAERVDGVPVELKQIPAKYMNAEQETIMSVFQYMIGNTDFSIPGFHNMKFIKSVDYSNQEPYVIPYDFDYTGFVAAPYAIPSEVLPIDKVTERYFMGACRSKAEYQKTFELFKSKRSQIYDLIQNFDLLTKQNKKRHIKYLNQFYSAIESNYTLNNNILGNCQR